MALQRFCAVARAALALLLLAGALRAPASGQGMVYHVDPVTLEVLETHVDSDLDTSSPRGPGPRRVGEVLGIS